MTRVEKNAEAEFFAAVDAASQEAVWAAIATVDGNVPRVRMVHPTWEGPVLWFATSADSPKAQQLRANPAIDIQYQVSSPTFVHILVHGRCEFPEDDATRQHVWNHMDYDLADFWPGGVTDPGFMPVKVVPSRVELSEMFGMQNKRVWYSDT